MSQLCSHARELWKDTLRYWPLFPPRRRRLSSWGYGSWLALGRIVAVLVFLHWVAPLVTASSYSAPVSVTGLVHHSQDPWLIGLLRSVADGLWALTGLLILAAALWRAFVMRLPILERIFFVWLSIWAVGIEFRYWNYDAFRSFDPYYLFKIRTPLMALATVSLVSFEVAVRRRRRSRYWLFFRPRAESGG